MARHRCDNCGAEYEEEELDDAVKFGLENITALLQRLDEGGIVPSGECLDPTCGALVYPLERTFVPVEVERMLRRLVEAYGRRSPQETMDELMDEADKLLKSYH